MTKKTLYFRESISYQTAAHETRWFGFVYETYFIITFTITSTEIGLRKGDKHQYIVWNMILCY